MKSGCGRRGGEEKDGLGGGRGGGGRWRKGAEAWG